MMVQRLQPNTNNTDNLQNKRASAFKILAPRMDTQLPSTFPPLPALPAGHLRWSANILEAHCTLQDTYKHAIQLARQEDLDPLRVAFHIDAITSDSVPILVALENLQDSDETPLAEEWIHAAAELLGDLVVVLRHVGELAKGKYVQSRYPDIPY